MPATTRMTAPPAPIRRGAFPPCNTSTETGGSAQAWQVGDRIRTLHRLAKRLGMRSSSTPLAGWTTTWCANRQHTVRRLKIGSFRMRSPGSPPPSNICHPICCQHPPPSCATLQWIRNTSTATWGRGYTGLPLVHGRLLKFVFDRQHRPPCLCRPGGSLSCTGRDASATESQIASLCAGVRTPPPVAPVPRCLKPDIRLETRRSGSEPRSDGATTKPASGTIVPARALAGYRSGP
jgi:hypothetical protein